MKINKLLIKNINSLAGEHVIDFDEIHDHSEGVYLIIGATGSGKTTILDAITLGLFGEVKRMGDITAGNIGKTGSIITHGMKEARVDVIFTSKGEKYIARWQIRHKVRSAGWEAAQMSLYDVNDQLLESGLSPVKRRIIEIIGMNCDQFNKAILLAQGDFASFLKSKFSEKADILEKITGTENYSRIGKAIFDKNNELKSIADQLQFSLNNLSVKSDEEVAEMRLRMQSFTENINQYQKRSNELNRLINDRNTYNKEQIQLKLIEEKLNNERTELKDVKSSHDLIIQQYDSAIGIKPVFDNHKILIAERPELLSLKNKLEDEKSSFQLKQVELYNETAKVFPIQRDEELFVTQVGKFKDEILYLENDLKAILLNKNNITVSLTAELKRAKEEENIKLLIDGDVKSISSKLQTKRTDHHTAIVELKMMLGISEVKEELLDEYQRSLREAEMLQKDRLRYIQLLSEIKIKSDQVIENEAEVIKLSNSIKSKHKEQELLEITVKDKETILIQQQKIKSLEHHRAQLAEGEDCPLCGALDGPLRHHGVQVSDQYQQEYDSAKKVLEALKTILVREETQIVSIKNIVEKLKTELADQSVAKESLSTEIVRRKTTLNITESINDPQILDNKVLQIENAIISLKKLIKLNEIIPNIDQAIIYCKELEGRNDQESLKSAELHSKFALKGSVQLWAENITNQFETNQRLLRKSQLDLSNNETLLVRNEQQLSLLSEEINSYISKNNLTSIENLEHLFGQQTAVEGWKKMIEKLQQQILTNESLFHSTLGRIKEVETRIDLAVENSTYEIEKQELNDKITTESEELGGIKAQLQVHDSNISKGEELKKELEKNEILWNPVKILNTLIGSSTGHEFKKIAQKITLSHLAVLANKHLSLMNDRYKFKFDTKELWSRDEADLMIYDAFDPEGLRSCATLSGGETFIASLALALGLSDFASENNKIESLFIDEGFGTLDPDTLEMAIGALEKIQSSGNKTLCLITHVEAMKERIPYHLVVEKGKKGMSTIRHEMA